MTRNQDRILRPVLWLVFFHLGASATLGQVLFFREILTVAHGNELCLSIILFAWFLGIATGAATGGRLGERTPENTLWISAILSLMAIFFCIQLGLLRILRWIVAVPPGEQMALERLFLGTLVAVVPFSFLTGLIFPFAGRMARRRQTGPSPSGVALVYSFEAAGSLVAGLLFTWFLVGLASPFLIAKCALLSAAILATLLCLVTGRKAGGIVFAGFFVLCLVFPTLWVNDWTARLRWSVQFPGIERLETRQSPYGQLDVAARAGQYILYSNGQPVTAFPDPYSHLQPVHTSMVQHASPQSVLLVGGNPEIVQLVLKHQPRRVDWVELDPQQARLMIEYSTEEARNILQQPAVRILFEDGRRLIARTRDAYDLILLNVPDPSTAQLNRYYTREFYQQAAQALRPDGVLATSIDASVRTTGRAVVDYAKSIYATLKEVFPYVAVEPGQTYRFYGCRMEGQVSEDPQVLASRYQRRGVEPAAIAYSFRTSFIEDRVEELKTMLESPPPAAINTDFRPVAYLDQIILWNRLSGSETAGWLLWLKGVSPLWMVVVPFAWLLIRHFVSRRQGASVAQFELVTAVAVLGMSAMSIELILLISFQNAFGVLYQKIAIFVALFMCGLTAGSFAVNEWIHRRKISPQIRSWVFLAIIALTILVAVALPFLLRVASAEGSRSVAFYYGVICLSGILTGAAFPPAVSLHHQRSKALARSAGVIDSADHLGAMAGALFAGTFWIPLWGIDVTLTLVAAANLVVLIGMKWTKGAI